MMAIPSGRRKTCRPVVLTAASDKFVTELVLQPKQVMDTSSSRRGGQLQLQGDDSLVVAFDDQVCVVPAVSCPKMPHLSSCCLGVDTDTERYETFEPGAQQRAVSPDERPGALLADQRCRVDAEQARRERRVSQLVFR